MRINEEMRLGIYWGKSMQPSFFVRWLVICLTSIVFSVTGFAEPPSGAKQLEVDEELKFQQKARQDYAGTWRIETIASKGNMSEPDKRIVVNNKADGTWTLLIDDEEFSSGTNTFCPLCDPQEIDISFTGGQGQGSVLQGIYEIEESTRRLCFQSGTGSRPNSFESLYGDENIVVTFVRE